MRIFVGYGYNPRDKWVETQVFPILQALGIEVAHGKDMHGEVLQEGVKARIEQSDALIAFCTLRTGQESAEVNTHVWVIEEMTYALALEKPIVEIRESGVNLPSGLRGDRQRIQLENEEKLRAVAELIGVVTSWSLRRLLLVPREPRQAREIHKSLVNKDLAITYRVRIKGNDSKFRDGRLEEINEGLYLSASGLPEQSLVEVVGTQKSTGKVLFGTGWKSADLIRIEF